MFLSDRDLRWALRNQHLLVEPFPVGEKQIGPNSIDLHLDNVDQAKVWDIPKFCEHNRVLGLGEDPDLRIGSFDYKEFAGLFQREPKRERDAKPEEGAQLICFIDGTSTRARTGLLVHMTAPTIHAAWGAWNITLEIANLGPFHLVLQEDDVVAQITVATLSSVPERTARQAGSVTSGQTGVGITS